MQNQCAYIVHPRRANNKIPSDTPLVYKPYMSPPASGAFSPLCTACSRCKPHAARGLDQRAAAASAASAGEAAEAPEAGDGGGAAEAEAGLRRGGGGLRRPRGGATFGSAGARQASGLVGPLLAGNSPFLLVGFEGSQRENTAAVQLFRVLFETCPKVRTSQRRMNLTSRCAEKLTGPGLRDSGLPQTCPLQATVFSKWLMPLSGWQRASKPTAPFRRGLYFQHLLILCLLACTQPGKNTSKSHNTPKM